MPKRHYARNNKELEDAFIKRIDKPSAESSEPSRTQVRQIQNRAPGKDDYKPRAKKDRTKWIKDLLG